MFCQVKEVGVKTCRIMEGVSVETASREEYLRRGRRLEYFTIAYNSLEGVCSIVAGLLAGSVSLVGFGLDSMIEVASGAALIWRLRQDSNAVSRENVERIALRVVGFCFVTLAAYVLYESLSTLVRQTSPQRSIVGIVVAGASVVVMPLLARSKRRVALHLGSHAMQADSKQADSKQADFCGFLSAILLCGLLTNALFGWWWMDPASALVMVPIIAKEGFDGLRGRDCCQCG